MASMSASVPEIQTAEPTAFERLVESLQNIERGQRIVYHQGVSLQDCSMTIRDIVQQLMKDNRARAHLQRGERTPKMIKADVPGPLEYVVVGR